MSFPYPSGQLSYNFLMTVATGAGMLYDIGFNNVLTPVATQVIPFGVGVAKVVGQDQQVRLPWQDIVAVTSSVNLLVTANSTVVTLNGIALTPVVYATSNAATMAVIAALIAAQPGIASAVSNGTTTITITATQGLPVTATFVTTLGASQPTWTSTYSNDNVFQGVSIFIQNRQNLLGPNGSLGAFPYQFGDAVPVLTRGRIYVNPETTVTSDSPVYWRIIPTLSNPQVGSFRGDSDSGNAILLPTTTGIRWWQGASASTPSAPTFAILDINLP